MLFQMIDGFLDGVIDVLSYGPIGAVDVWTSSCPGAERACRDITGMSTAKCLNVSTTSSNNSDKSSGNSKVNETSEEAKSTPTVVYKLTDNDVEILKKNFSNSDIADNISAAFYELDIEDDTDKDIVRYQVLTMLYMSSMINLDQVKNFCKTPVDYIAFNSFVTEYTGKAPDKLSITKNLSDIFGDAENAMEMAEFVKWEQGYISEKIDKAYEKRFLDTCDDILKHLKELKDIIDVQDPIVTVNPKTTVDNSTFSDEKRNQMKAALEHGFEKLLEPYKFHAFNVFGFGVAELVISSDDLYTHNRYRVDPDTILGNGYNVIWSYIPSIGMPAVDIYINIKHTDIISKIFADPNYQLTGEEISKCLNDRYLDDSIYYYFDMTSFKKYKKRLNEVQNIELGKKLSAVSYLMGTGEIPQCRLRLEKWNGINNFSIVSDKQAISPLVANKPQGTCAAINEDMRIEMGKGTFKVGFITVTGEKCEPTYQISSL